MGSTKLTKVEIEAFRGILEHQVFDFTHDGTNPADIVAIFAPNGFGKTSFFDAIEWSLKREIQRYEDNPNLTKQINHENRTILRHHLSSLDRGEVCLHETSGAVFIRKTATRVNDYLQGTRAGRGESLILNTYKNEFDLSRMVEILPQNSIDTFLSAKSPEDRYQALVDFWGGRDDSRLYVGIRSLEKENDKKVSQLKQKIQETKHEIDSVVVPQVSSEIIEDKIDRVNNSTVFAEPLHKPHDLREQKDLVEFNLSINDQIAFVEKEGKSTDQKVERLRQLEGDYSQYKENETHLIGAQKELKKVDEILSKNEQSSSLLKQVDKLTGDKNKLGGRKKEFEEVASTADKFSEIDNSINALNKQHQELLKQEIELINQRGELSTDLETKSKYFTEQQKNLKSKQVQSKKARKTLSDAGDVLNSQEQWSGRVKLVGKLNAGLTRQQGSIREEINVLMSYVEGSLNYVLENEVPLKGFEKALHKLKVQNGKLKETETALKTAQSTYDKLGDLEENFQKLLSFGHRHVSETEEKNCPLCQTDHGSFQNLLELIDNQKKDVFDIKRKGSELELLRSEREEVRRSLDEALSSFREEIGERERQLHDQISKINDRIEKLNQLEKYQTSRLEDLQSYIDKATEDYGLSTFSSQKLSEFTEQLDKEIEEINLEVLSNGIEELKKRISESDSNKIAIETIKGRIEKEIDLLKLDNSYKKTLEFLKRENIEQKIFIKEKLKDQIIEIEKSLETVQKDLSDTQEKSSRIRLELVEVVLDEVEARKLELKDSIPTLESWIKRYSGDFNRFVSEEVKIEKKLISSELKSVKVKAIELSAILTLLLELRENLKDIEQHVRLSSLRNDLDDNESQLDLLKKVGKKLKSIKIKTRVQLDEKVNSVFNKEIINDIYQKIDPHPNLKEISLDIDFDDVKPTLEFRNSDGTNPAVYFSSAQLNVLSLSIFLAKALQNNKTVVNTIFMDDPIQYMDSINTLSFIDLIRAVIDSSELDRQLVISTHDENFFGLLKNKFDPDYYRSKFIEFESYGKLKQA